MFRTSLVLWIAKKNLTAVLFENGERHYKIVGTIIMAKEVLDSRELSFAQEVHILRQRGRKAAAYMTLVETASAWSVAGNECYSNYCLQAAKRLLYIFFAEDDPIKGMVERFDACVAIRLEERALDDEIIAGS
jgi:hypothetical protein